MVRDADVRCPHCTASNTYELPDNQSSTPLTMRLSDSSVCTVPARQPKKIQMLKMTYRKSLVIMHISVSNIWKHSCW